MRSSIPLSDSTTQCEFELKLSQHPDPSKPGHLLVQAEMKVMDPDQKATPRHLVFVLDKSGSMDGRPIQQLKAATTALVERLAPQDRASIITFDDEAKCLASQVRPQTAIKAIATIPERNGSGTNIKAGMLAIQRDFFSIIPQEQSTVILLTDGDDGHHLKPAEAISELRNQLRGLPRFIAMGLGPKYRPHVLDEIGRATGFPKIHLHDEQAVQRFLDQADEYFGQRVPVSVTIRLGQNYFTHRASEGSGINLDHPWRQVFEISLDDFENQPTPIQFSYVVGGRNVDIQGSLKPANTQDSSVIDTFISQQADQIFNLSHLPAVKQIQELEKLLALVPAESNALRGIIQGSIGALISSNDQEEINRYASMTSTTTYHGAHRTQQMYANLSSHPQYDASKKTLLVHNKESRLIDRQFNFAEEIKSSLVSVDAGVTTREAVVLHPDAAELKGLEAELKDNEDVDQIVNRVHSIFIKPVADSNLVQTTLICRPISSFIRNQTGNCRHHALLTAYLVGLQVRKGHLSKGEVHLFRGTAWNLRAHAWVIYKTDRALYLLDSTAAQPNHIFNLTERTERRRALEFYTGINLEGVLEDLFHHYQLYHPKMTGISESAIALIPDNKQDLFVQQNMICPIGLEVMREPVLTVDNHVFERQNIQEWFARGNRTNPLTRQPIDTQLRLAHAKTKAIWELMQTVAIQPEKALAESKSSSPTRKTPQKAVDEFVMRTPPAPSMMESAAAVSYASGDMSLTYRVSELTQEHREKKLEKGLETELLNKFREAYIQDYNRVCFLKRSGGMKNLITTEELTLAGVLSYIDKKTQGCWPTICRSQVVLQKIVSDISASGEKARFQKLLTQINDRSVEWPKTLSEEKKDEMLRSRIAKWPN